MKKRKLLPKCLNGGKHLENGGILSRINRFFAENEEKLRNLLKTVKAKSKWRNLIENPRKIAVFYEKKDRITFLR